MGLYFTAGFLLIVHAFHLALLQDSTDSPGRTFPQNWLRGGKDTAGNLNSSVTEDLTEYDQGADAATLDQNNDYSGTASGSMAIFDSKEEGNLLGHEKGKNKTHDNLNVVTTTLPPTFPNGTTRQPELPDTTVSQSTTTMDATNSSQNNMTKAKEDSYNSTTTPQSPTTPLISQNSTSLPNFSNRTDLGGTATQAPENSTTREFTTKPEKDTGLTNSTSSTNTTTATNTTPEMNKTSTTSSSTTVIPAETTETNPEITTAPKTPEMANKTDKDVASGSSSKRGLASDSRLIKRNAAWGAVLGTMVAVVIVGLAGYIILKKKQPKGFSHRKLVEEYPSDPVLRLDNSEPLDLNFSGSAYYNPGLQGDNIQMTHFPGCHRN